MIDRNFNPACEVDGEYIRQLEGELTYVSHEMERLRKELIEERMKHPPKRVRERLFWGMLDPRRTWDIVSFAIGTMVCTHHQPLGRELVWIYHMWRDIDFGEGGG